MRHENCFRHTNIPVQKMHDHSIKRRVQRSQGPDTNPETTRTSKQMIHQGSSGLPAVRL